MIRPARRQNGFTLMEILIVVVILGILAAIVVPQFTNASDLARRNTTYENLQAIRSQLEIYSMQHNDDYPSSAQMWSSLLGKTNADGDVVPDGKFGPYLQYSPVNPYTLSAALAEPGAGASTDGWEYNETTGALTAVGFDEKTGEYDSPQ